MILIVTMLLYILNKVKSLFTPKENTHQYYKTSQNNVALDKTILRSRKKPQWVIDEVIKIKAIIPTASCRTIAIIFNQRYANHHPKQESIGKTFVGYTNRKYLYEIQIQRKKIKSRPAYQILFNKVWGMDITFVQQQPILGIIEHHSRKASLIPIKQKTSITILRTLLDILETTPKPKVIRTDNEICFNSKLIKLGLWILGIKKQTTQKHCPWQNGRVERLFGTLKATIKHLPKQNESDLPYLIHSFEFWYNQIKPHQNLDNQTPESVYQKKIKQWQKENPPDG